MTAQMCGPRLRLTDLRETLGWSKSELARRARIDQGNMGRYESGRMKPYPVELQRIARALKWPAEDADKLLDPAVEQRT